MKLFEKELAEGQDIFDLISPDTKLKPFTHPERKPLNETDVMAMVQGAIDQIPKPKAIEKIVEKQIIKEVKDTKQYVEMKVVEELKKQIEELKNELKKNNSAYPMQGWGFRTGKIIPSLSGNQGKYLRVSGNKIVWDTVTASGGGSSSDVYTTNNVTTTRTLDPTTSTIDDLYNFVGSLIQSLQGAGIVQ